MPKYKLYWRDGSTNIVQGRNYADAMIKAGYGAGAIAALDYYILHLSKVAPSDNDYSGDEDDV